MSGTVRVWDVQRQCMTEVTEAEARAGLARYARTLGPGSAACGAYEARAVAPDLLASQQA